jgi:hypothetical protein
MPDLEALRNTLRADDEVDSEAPVGLKDFIAVDIAGMSPDGQEHAIKEAALDLDWCVDVEVVFEGCYKLRSASTHLESDLEFGQRSADDDKAVAVIVRPPPV